MGTVKQQHFISAGQLFSLLFIGRIIIVLTINAQLAGGDSILDNTVSAVFALALNFVLIIPLWLLYRRRPALNVLDSSYFLFGKIGTVICMIYAVYFVVVNWYYLSFFQLYIGNVMNPNTPVWIVAAAVLVVSCYGAFKGVEAIARASGVILVIICAGIIFIIVTLFSEINPLNYEPLLYRGPRQAVTGVMLFLARSTGFASLAVMLPKTKGRKKLGFVLWNVGVYVFITVLLLVIVGAAGDYLKNQLFPVYAASALAEAGPFQRLDAIYLGIWMMGLFVKIAFDLFLISVCITKIWSEKAGKVSILVGGVLIAVVAQVTAYSRALQNFVYGLWFLGAFTLSVAFVIPLLLLLTDVVKNGRKTQSTKGKAG